MNLIVVYGGRFNPPHLGHIASFKHLQDKFGHENVYMSSADKPISKDDPLMWDEKKKLLTHLGLPQDKFLKISNPYNSFSIKQSINFKPQNTILVLALSKKDANRLIGNNHDSQGYVLTQDGKRAAIQPLRKKPQPLANGYMYVTITPTKFFQVINKSVCSGTEIRNMYSKANLSQRQQILYDLYGEAATPEILSLFNQRIKVSVTESLTYEFGTYLNNF